MLLQSCEQPYVLNLLQTKLLKFKVEFENLKQKKITLQVHRDSLPVNNKKLFYNKYIYSIYYC